MKTRGIYLILGASLMMALIAMTACAVEGDSLWSHTYGGSFHDVAYSIIPSGDGGFLLAGETESFGAGWTDMWLVKVDSDGDSLWSKTYGGGSVDWVHSIIPSSDGGFLLAGQTASFGAGNCDMWLVKVDADGDSLWSHTYGGSSYDFANSILPSGDGGFLLAGITSSFGAGWEDMWLVKVDADGDSLWSHTYGGGNCDWASSIVPSGDGGFLLAGYSCSFGAGGYDMWLVKVDADGNLLWSKTYGGSSGNAAHSIIPSGDGGFLLAGFTSSFGAGELDMWLIKVNANGDSLWSHTYGGNADDWAFSIFPSDDSGFLLAGGTSSFSAGGYDIWLVKVDTEGDSLWSQTYGGSSSDWAESIIPSGDGGFLLAGATSSFGAGDDDMWLVKVEGPSTSPVTLSLDPLNPPIILPANGGTFSYDVSVSNDTTAPVTFDGWIMVRLPNQAWYGPVLGPLTLTLPVNATLTRLRDQTVPGSAPSGNYLYEGRVGDYPNVIWVSDNFSFTKLGVVDGNLGLNEWMNTGESFEQGITRAEELIPSSLFLVTCSPNPFNPSTVISYELRAASYVTLGIYDLSGRLVTTLVEGQQTAGTHEATFDGSDLASGIYLAKLTAGENTAVQKLVLLK